MSLTYVLRRNVIQPTLSNLIEVLDSVNKSQWDVECIEDDGVLIFQSFCRDKDSSKRIVSQLRIQTSPFKISAIQPLKTTPAMNDPLQTSEAKNKSIDQTKDRCERPLVVWETIEYPLSFQETATILTVRRPKTAAYLGFGEQGGASFLRDRTYMNFFGKLLSYYVLNIYDSIQRPTLKSR